MAYLGLTRFFWACLSFTFLAVLFDFISFCSGYWIVAYPEFKSPFVRLGLWEACFNGFFAPQDYNGKLYNGCWWVFYPEYRFIFGWLNPPWMIGVQTIQIIALLLHIMSTISLGLYFTGHCQRSPVTAMNVTGLMMFIAGLCFSITVIIMGVESKDRSWMPQPDQNHLSWSFAFAVLSAFFSILSAGFFGWLAQKEKEQYAQTDENKQYLHDSEV